MADLAEEPRQLLRRITEEIWTGGRLDLVDELVAEDFVDHIEIPGLDAVGRDRYRASVILIRDAFPDYEEEIVMTVAEGDLAVSFVRSTGTHRGVFHGIEPTGRRVEWQSIGALRFKDGQAAERWGIGDSLTLMTQLGLLG